MVEVRDSKIHVVSELDMSVNDNDPAKHHSSKYKVNCMKVVVLISLAIYKDMNLDHDRAQ